jgi:hypothetical protein
MYKYITDNLYRNKLGDSCDLDKSDIEILYDDLEEHIFYMFDSIVKIYIKIKNWVIFILNYFASYLVGPLLYFFMYLIQNVTHFQLQSKKSYIQNKKIITTLIVRNVSPQCLSIISSLYINICNIVYYMVGMYYALHGRNMEPVYKEWINVTLLEPRNPDNINEIDYKYNEKYMEVVNSNDDECLRYIKNIHDSNKSTISIAGLIIIKIENLYTYQLMNSTNFKYIEIENEISDVRFLSIEYSHPKMNKTLYIELSKNHLLIGNKILSFVFVLRYLHYNYSQYQYIFDEDYILTIMDNNINMITVNSKQYCELEESMYKIVNIDV